MNWENQNMLCQGSLDVYDDVIIDFREPFCLLPTDYWICYFELSMNKKQMLWLKKNNKWTIR